jgi:hypothetical protein
VRVDRDALDRAHLHALRLVKVPHTFGATVRVDLVELLAHRDRLVRALGLADIAVDALGGDHQAMSDLQPFAGPPQARPAPLGGSDPRSGGVWGLSIFRLAGRAAQPLSDTGADHLRHVATERGDLAHQGAGNALQVGLGQQEHGLDAPG